MTNDDREKRRAAAFRKLAGVVEGMGLPHATALVYTALTLAPDEGLSTSELVEQLDVSRASISNATQLLVGTQLVEKYRVSGSRETHYRILKGAWGPMLAKKFAVFQTVTATVEDAMEYTESPQALERLEEMRDVYSFFADEFVNIMDRWDERKKR